MVNLAEIIQGIIQTNQITSEVIASLITFSVVVLIGWLAYYVFGRYILARAKKTKTTVDDYILDTLKKITLLVILLVGSYYTLTSLTFLQIYQVQLSQVFTVIGILTGAFMATRISNSIANWFILRKSKENTNAKNNHILFILKKIIQLFVYIIAFLIILWVLGIDLSSVVVGLGVGGIAIAFALQSTLSDVFSAFSIYFDRPFEIGDFIVVGDYSGTVTNIGVKSTRIKMLQGEELIVSNQELTSTYVRNFKKLDRRRVTFTLGVTYNTPFIKAKKIPEIIKDIFEKVELADIDKIHFTEFGDFSLKFVVIYYVKVADYGKYLETQEVINFAIMEAFEKEGIAMAFPTQTIYLEK